MDDPSTTQNKANRAHKWRDDKNEETDTGESDGSKEVSDDKDYESSDTETEDYKVVFNQELDTVKLPNGFTRVYMGNENREDLIQVTFPQTSHNQYWRAFRMITVQQTIMVHPRSNLELHIKTLREYYKMHTKVGDAMYSTIDAPGEVEIFGVYISPLIRTHVFVGPFTIFPLTGCSKKL